MSREVELKFSRNTFVLKRLAFLGDFLIKVGCKNITEIAKITNTSYQNIHVKLYNDDMFLSEVFKIVEHYGYIFKIRMEKSEQTKDSNDNVNSICEYSIEPKKSDRKLYFLESALRENSIIMTDIVKAGIVSRETYHSRFQKDDCPFSYITDIANKMNLKIIIEISHTA